ncbi:MAG TPA: acetoacetate--CoA ligase [Acidimicrobiales bacterium]
MWRPPANASDRTRIGGWLRWLREERGLAFEGYHEAWAWSVDDLEGFWSSVVDHLGVRWRRAPDAVLGDRRLPGATWFPGGTLNYAEHALAAAPAGPAVLSISQTREPIVLTGPELTDQVARARAGLARLGVGPGDRVAAYLPNVAEAVVAFLATASLGAIWSSCPPEFGPRGVIDRFAQIEPTVLLAVDGYRHRGRPVDRRGEVAAIAAALPGLRATVVLPYLDAGATLPGAMAWDDLLAGPPDPGFAAVAAAHPLYILYSSGTTGLPKPIVHGHAGILVEHLKMLALHHDMGPGDRFFWFSTTGWMMWNYLVSGLLVGSSIVLFDGDPGHPDLGVLWRLAADTGITHLGASAPWLLACRKAGLSPRSDLDLSRLREVGSTGAPLPADGFRWVYDHVKRDVLLASISGGTDVCTAFVGGVPLLPVYAGEISCRCLGARVEAYDDDGRPVVGRQGNLVVTAPMPSMPVGLWGDGVGERYRSAYFERFPGVWDHGDWITITERGTCVITGRSDSTLNRGGVRLGTSDFYAVVEARPEVADSLVVHLEDASGGPGELLLFIQPAPGAEVDDDLRAAVVSDLRTALSPRHAPDRIIAVPSVPRTLSGKKLEVPVKRILSGTPAALAASKDALADPGSLAPFEALAADRAARRGRS